MSQQYYSPAPPPSAPNSGMAVASLIASILGLTLIPTIGSVIGLILGYMARNRIRDSAGTLGGEGLAKAGIILGWIGVAFIVIGVCVGVAIFGGTAGITICAGLGEGF